MNITVILVQFWGIVLAITGLSMIANKKGTAAALAAITENRGLLWTVGFFTLLLGAALVVLDSTWTSGMALLITIISWLVLIKGAFILFFSDAAAALYKRYNTDGVLVFWGVIAFIIGLVFLYLGFA
jgi:hypothetical protein